MTNRIIAIAQKLKSSLTVEEQSELAHRLLDGTNAHFLTITHQDVTSRLTDFYKFTVIDSPFIATDFMESSTWATAKETDSEYYWGEQNSTETTLNQNLHEWLQSHYPDEVKAASK